MTDKFKTSFNPLFLFFIALSIISCAKDNGDSYSEIPEDEIPSATLNAITEQYFGNNVSFDDLSNYANQPIPDYITEDNSEGNDITDDKATLGRILFYDKNLSTDNSISCASCHQQENAFSDLADVSTGVNGVTGRHSMRLINARFAAETRFFWDERAGTLEAQTTQPIQDHAEMGFSGQDDAPILEDLLVKLSETDYYPTIFNHIYGDDVITEARLQESLAQFIRSIQSFDSKYDEGRSQAPNDNQNFVNFTAQENIGKQLFVFPRNQNGAGCAGCHRPPSFDIDPQSLNNGVVGVFGSTTDQDFNVTRAPSLRDLVKANGAFNGAFMHDASAESLLEVVAHYNNIDATNNNNLDPRLNGAPNENGQQLDLSAADMDALVAFLITLAGDAVYSDPKWSDPFVN
jgi:cytochrome c peroxidase